MRPRNMFNVDNTGSLTLRSTTTNTRIVSPQFEVWDEAEGTGDYLSFAHTGVKAVITAGTGLFELSSNSNLLDWDGTMLYGTVNLRDLGGTSNEWRALYLGSSASSGLYLGLNQEARLFYSGSTDLDLVCPTGSGLSIWNSAQATADNVRLYHSGTHGYVQTMSGNLMLQAVSVTYQLSSTALIGGITLDLGTAAEEWRALYVGSGASSGVFFGLNQEARLSYPGSQGLYLQTAGSGFNMDGTTVAPLTPVEGQIYYHQGSHNYYFWNASAWVPLG